MKLTLDSRDFYLEFNTAMFVSLQLENGEQYRFFPSGPDELIIQKMPGTPTDVGPVLATIRGTTVRVPE